MTGHPGDKSEGREVRDSHQASGPHDSSNRHERQADDKPQGGRRESDGIPKTREAEPEDPSNRIERDDRTPYDNMRKPDNEGGSSYSEYRPKIGGSPQPATMEKMPAGKNPYVDERTGKLDPTLG